MLKNNIFLQKNKKKLMMKTKMFFYFFCFFISCFQAFSMAAENRVDLNNEVSALLSLKAGFVDPMNHLQDWEATNSSAHCNWAGVQCNFNGAVERLDLSNMNLTGTISVDIQQLMSLTYLNICCNGFASSLPQTLSNLTALKIIDVSENDFFDSGGILGRMSGGGLICLNASGNNFSGSLPEDLGNARFLEFLDLRGNYFEGPIPESYMNLVNLKFLGLSGNNLTGLIPPELGQLSSLETMILGYNEFDGGIPKEFGNLTSLKYLDLAFGGLNGSIPSELGNLNALNVIFLFKNNLVGTIPPSLGNLSLLQQLDLSDNMLSGQIPIELTNLKNLWLLNLMCNQLSGTIPSGFADLTNLQVLELWNNTLTGALPKDLGQNSPLQWLDISTNSISGPIPTGLCNQGNLTKLIVFNNQLTGLIPPVLSACASLVRVRMHNNLLSGTIPVGFGKLLKLQRLELANNNLSGQIPFDLSSSITLNFIDFSQNRLQFSLPSSILTIPTLQNFLIADNNLAGGIPNEFQDCPTLSVLDLSSNRVTGTVPVSISSCEKLVTLNLRNNQLTGTIPATIAMMPTLAVLDLSNNSLTGGIPVNFGNSPALEAFNVSFNKLQGPVPENGLLRTINPDDLKGNADLCGGVLLPCSRNSVYISSQKNSRAKRAIAVWLIATATLLTLVIIGIGARVLYKRWYNKGSCFEERIEVSSSEWPWRLMAFQRLGFTSNDILACLKESNVIGMGATGVVYIAKMDNLKAVVAVKKLWRSVIDVEKGGSHDLLGEVNLLGGLRHRNIVRLLGLLHNDTNAMIIYEYMPNGSLWEALHGKQAGKLLVDWVSRYNIAMGVAQGLAYLHHDCHPQVIHRDVKSSNILLDDNLEARIADFGLAKMMLTKNETVSVVAGSYGYIAPEYGYTLKVDEKIDVYSYGVVLMELLSGKKALDPEFGEAVDIVEWIRTKIRNNKALETALDKDVGITKHVQEEMLLVLRIAILCTAKLPKDRPSMRDVITMLGEAKPRRKSSCNHGNNDTFTDKDKPVFTTSPVNGLI